MSAEEHRRQLCQAQMEGLATESESAEFARLIQDDPAALKAYLDQMKVHAMLTWQHGGSHADVLTSRAPAKVSAHLRWSLGLALCACLMMAGMMLWWTQQAERPTVRYEVLLSDHAGFRAGEVRQGRELELDRGTVSFRTTEGAVVDVTGPAKLELISPMHLRVLHGGVTADISDGKKGFIIETPEARVVDLGTRFSVAAGGPQGTEVAVFEGKVEVYDRVEPAPTDAPQVTLHEGEAVRIDVDKQLRPIGLLRLAREAPESVNPDEPEVVGDVRDNQAGGKRFYGLVRGGMADGAKAYTTRSGRIWHHAAGASFPEELVGADQVRTVASYRSNADFRITLKIDRPCVLYVLADESAPPPEWLVAGFSNTQYKVQSGPWARPAEIPEDAEIFHVSHAVWKRRIDKPGTVELGSPQAAGSRLKPVMYGIVVKPLP